MKKVQAILLYVWQLPQNLLGLRGSMTGDLPSCTVPGR